ncbi:MAG: phosphohydrolase, partial [Desulfobacterales bacterium]
HHHHPRPEETLNFKVVYDADLITNLEEKHKEKPIDHDRLTRIIESSFLTESGREEAKRIFLN